MSPPARNTSFTTILQQVGALGAVLLVAASCAVGPDYQRPQSEVPAAWEGVAPPALSLIHI